jgi:hypothetical protein
VKLPDLADTAVSAAAGMVVAAATVTITMKATALLTSRPINVRTSAAPWVGEEGMTIPIRGSGHSLQEIRRDTQVKERNYCY